MFQTTCESKIISAFQLIDCHIPCSFNFLYTLQTKATSDSVKSHHKTLPSEGSYAVFWGLTAPFLPHDIFWASVHTRTAGHVTLLAAEVGHTVLLSFIVTYRSSSLWFPSADLHTCRDDDTLGRKTFDRMTMTEVWVDRYWVIAEYHQG